MLILALACFASCETSQASDPQPLFAPAPKYPLSARIHYWTGNGIFISKTRPDGTVSAVDVRQSTGHEILDQSAIAALRRWRFKAGAVNIVSTPISFWMPSHIRHRMAGGFDQDAWFQTSWFRFSR
jgi:TonB family protein